jgi:exonuclease III
VLALQEIRWTGTGILEKRKHVMLYSGHQKKHEFGVGFLVNNAVKLTINGFEPVSHRICVLRIAGRFLHYNLINVNGPTEDSDEEEKENFYDVLNKVYKKYPRHDVKIILGDMNAQVGKDLVCERNVGKYEVHEKTNDNGSRLIDFAIYIYIYI